MNSTPIQFYGLIIVLSITFYSNLSNQFSRGNHKPESVFIAKTGSTSNSLENIPKHKVQALPMLSGEKITQDKGWIAQITMNFENIPSSGRKLIWLNYINYIQTNLFFGNGSDKLLLSSWIEKTQTLKLIHAHNSFLMMISTNGILISILYCLFYLFYFKANNYLALGAIILYSFGNYGIFWGFSYMDVIFFMLLTYSFNHSYDYPRKS